MLVNRNKHVLKWGNETRNRNFMAATKLFSNILKVKTLPLIRILCKVNFSFFFFFFFFNFLFFNLIDKKGKNYIVRFIYYQKLSNEQSFPSSCFRFPLKISY